METEKTIQFDIAKLEVKLQEYALLITQATNSLKKADEPDKIDRLSNKILAYKAAYDVTTKELDALKLKKIGGLKDWSPNPSEIKPIKKSSGGINDYLGNGNYNYIVSKEDYITANALGSPTIKTISTSSHTHSVIDPSYISYKTAGSDYMTYKSNPELDSLVSLWKEIKT